MCVQSSWVFPQSSFEFMLWTMNTYCVVWEVGFLGPPSLTPAGTEVEEWHVVDRLSRLRSGATLRHSVLPHSLTEHLLRARPSSRQYCNKVVSDKDEKPLLYGATF